ncbi:MAG TPA: hypothetical protein VMV00_01740 [Candidatus Baltobacteraceae bacterium]|nr:hypothetical protein [Candidatus Baltobacteraceae bacterium]
MRNRKRRGADTGTGRWGTRGQLAVLLMLLVLTLAVRLYYFTGPTFANTQDEGIYYNIFLQGVVMHNYPHFTQYLNADFGTPDQGIFNPANIPSFYSGFIYPEMFLLKMLGFSANLALYYVILTSLIEGLFLFLLIREVGGFRPAAIGMLLFAFFPLDVMFANRLEPLVPAMMFVTIATYLLVLMLKARKPTAGRVATLATLVGFFIGLGYITNPLSLSLFLFFAIYMAGLVLQGKQSLRGAVFRLGAVAVGLILAFSLSGTLYYVQSGNFFLYPMVDRIAAVNNIINQPVSPLTQLGSLSIVRLNVDPLFYLPIFFNFHSPQPYNSSYFSVLGYATVLSAIALVVLRVRFAGLFSPMLLSYFILINLFPIASYASGGVTKVLLVYMEPMLMTLLTLPVIVLSAMGIEWLLQRKDAVLWAVGVAVVIAAVWASVINLNSDVALPRASMVTVHNLSGFVQSLPNATFYINPYMAGEVAVLDGSTRGVVPMTSCTKPYINNISVIPNTYVVAGGSAGMDVDEGVITSFSNCELDNLTTGSAVVYASNNPYGGQPGLQVYRLGGG